MSLKEKVYKHFDLEIQKIKEKKPEVYQGLINHHKKEFYKNYFYEEISKLVEKRAKKGDFAFTDERIRKLVVDCIDFYVFAFITEKNKQNESPITKFLREEADRKARMWDLAAVKNEFTDELAEIKDFVQDGGERDTYEEKESFKDT